MNRFAIIAILAIKLSTSPLYAQSEDVKSKDPIVSIAAVQYNESDLEDADQLKRVISQMLYQSGYDHNSSKISILETQKIISVLLRQIKAKNLSKSKRKEPV